MLFSGNVVVVGVDGGCNVGRWSNLGGGPAGDSRSDGGIHPNFGLGFMTVGVLVEVVVVVSTSWGGEASDMPSHGLSMGLLSATSEGFHECASSGSSSSFGLVIHAGIGA